MVDHPLFSYRHKTSQQVFAFLQRVSCHHTFWPVICSRKLPFCCEDFPLNDVKGYLDLSFDNLQLIFPIHLMKFVDQKPQIQGKLLGIIKHNAIYLSAISNFLMH